MKEVIIRYTDSRVLVLLKSLAGHFGFSIAEKQDDPLIPKSAKQETHQATDFVNKWAGFLKKDDTDNSRYDYLMEKYK